MKLSDSRKLARLGNVKSSRPGQQSRFRKEARRTTKSDVGIDAGGGDWRIFPLSDLSPYGCNVHFADGTFRIGQFLSLKFAETGKVQGIVRWMRDGKVGVEFARPLPAGVIDLMAQPQ